MTMTLKEIDDYLSSETFSLARELRERPWRVTGILLDIVRELQRLESEKAESE